MTTMIFYWAVMLASYFAASRLRKNNIKISSVPNITMIIVYMLVFIMGLRLGSDHQLLSQIKSIGAQAVIITVACVAGSMIAVSLLRKLTGIDKFGNINMKAAAQAADNAPACQTDGEKYSHSETGGLGAFSEIRSTAIIVAFVAAGVVAGAVVFNDPSESLISAFDSISGNVTSVLLCIMLAFIGFDLGLSGKAGACFRSAGIRAFAFPVAAIAGTLVMGAVAGNFMGFSVKEGLAISAGFGWYTYAPVVIANAGAQYASASAVAFLYNMIRETASIMLIPIFARRVGYLEAVSMPGTSSMDICMPIIESSCRQDTVMYAFLTGFMMNIVASAGVPLIMNL